MPDLSPGKLLSSLRGDPPGGVFFLHGDESYLRDEAADAVVAAHLDPATRDFNLDARRGSDVSPEELASLIATPPMMAEWRVVVVRDAQGLSPKARDAVLEAAQAPPPGLALVLSASISGSKAKFWTQLRRAATSAEFAPLDPLDAPGWLIEHAAEVHGLEVEPEAARAIVASMGVELGAISSELRKLVDYVGERRRVGVSDVEAVVGSLPRQDRWAWFDMVAERRFAEALATLPLMLEQGESGVGLVIGITGQMLRVGLVCAGGKGALERELKPYQRWMARRVVPQAKRWTLAEVDRALAELLRTDRLLKSASLNDRQMMEELLLRLADIGAEGRGRRDAA